MYDLIGRKFRRNRYGLSKWFDTCYAVHVSWEHIIGNIQKAHILIRGTNHVYPLEEIVFIRDPDMAQAISQIKTDRENKIIIERWWLD